MDKKSIEKKSIETMVQTVVNNYVNFIHESDSKSVSKEKIINLIEGLEERGITVKVATLPSFKDEGIPYKVKTFRVDKEHPFEICDNVDTLFLYQWYVYKKLGFEVIRFATKLKSEKEN